MLFEQCARNWASTCAMAFVNWIWQIVWMHLLAQWYTHRQTYTLIWVISLSLCALFTYLSTLFMCILEYILHCYGLLNDTSGNLMQRKLCAFWRIYLFSISQFYLILIFSGWVLWRQDIYQPNENFALLFAWEHGNFSCCHWCGWADAKNWNTQSTVSNDWHVTQKVNVMKKLNQNNNNKKQAEENL